MADTFTTHYNLTKPQVGGDPDTWGGLLNTNFDTIDSQLYTASTYALPLTGGSLTGGVTITTTGAGGLTVASNSTNSTSLNIQNTAASGRNWALGSSGGGPASVGNFFIYDTTAGALRFTIDASGNATFLQALASSGALSGSSVTSTGGTLNGSASAIVLQPTGVGAIYLRPNTGSATGQATITSDGRLTINGPTTANGAVGIVTSGNTGSLSITDTGAYGAGIALNGSGGTTPNKYIRASGGSLQIINSAYSAAISTLDDTGHWTATDFTATSDARLKTHVQRLRRGLDELKHMLPREYIKAGREEVGFIAQEVREVLPEAVYEDEKGILSVSYGQLVALLAAAVLDIDRRLQTEGI